MNHLTSVQWSFRSVTRYAVVLLAGVIAGGRAVSAVQFWQQYLRSSQDPSAADAYLTFMATDLVIVVLSIVAAGLVWWLTRATSSNSVTRTD